MNTYNEHLFCHHWTVQQLHQSNEMRMAAESRYTKYVRTAHIRPSNGMFMTYCPSMALQSFVGPWPLFLFLNLIHDREDPLDEGSARRKAATSTQDSTNTE
jgi:hypothetical protein